MCMWICNDRDLKKNILKFGYGINYKYEGTLSYSFDRFYEVTKFELPKVEDLKLTKISYRIRTMVVGHLDAHVHEHLLNKRVMHMHMHIP